MANARAPLPSETPRGILAWIRKMRSHTSLEMMTTICNAAWNDATCPWVYRSDADHERCRMIARKVTAFARRHRLPCAFAR